MSLTHTYESTSSSSVSVSSELRWGAKLGSGALSLSGHVSLLCPSFLHTLQPRAFFAGFPVLHDGFVQLFWLCPFCPQFPHDCCFRFSPTEGIRFFFGLPVSRFFFHGNTTRLRTSSAMSHSSGFGTGFTTMAYACFSHPVVKKSEHNELMGLPLSLIQKTQKNE